MFPAALAALLSLFLFCSTTVVASPYVVTSYYENKVSTYDDYTYEGVYTTSVEAGDTITRLVNVKPTATAISTLSADTTTDDYYDDVTIVNVLVPTGVGEPITYDRYATTTTTSYYGYYIKLSYTAPTSCATEWVYTTSAGAYLPPMITPTPTSVSTRLTQYEAFGETSTYLYAFIDPTVLPTSSLSSIKSNYAPYFTSSCTVPSSYQTGLVTPGTGGSSDDSSDSGDDYNSDSSSFDGDECRPETYGDNNSLYGGDAFQTRYICPDGTSYTKGPSDLTVALAIIFGWIGLFLIIGFIESYIAFSRLVHGRRARRGLPIAFAGMFPFLSCFFLCCHQRGFQDKTEAEQETLTAEWKATGFFTKLGRWLKWGFRYKYPTFLGTAPLRRKKWQDKDTPAGANVPLTVAQQQQMAGPQGPLPPPGSMYVVGPPPNVDGQRGSVYPQPGAPVGGWYAPRPLDANGNPVPYQYMYPPQGYAQQPAQASGALPGPIPEGIPQSLQPGQGSPPLPTRPQEAHLSAGEGSRALSTGSPVSPASALAGGSPVVAGAVPVVAGTEVVSGEAAAVHGAPDVVHEAPAGEVRGVGNVEEGKGKGPEVR
ncbi:hypothetical protein VE03_06149 [Pseudogymnoascus sp. 23342-1-I1]|nr:hypothetical protein VE03_06149 [Pseudogymnoascus sp. 23342-1-I1]